jgi:hypothetical protein
MTYDGMEIEFNFKGKQCTALADIEYDLERSDVGPEGNRNHVWVSIPVNIEVSNISASLDDEDLSSIPDDLKEEIENRMIAKAEMDLETDE